MSDASALSLKSTPLCDSRLALSTGMSTCCSSRRQRDLAAPSRAFALPPFPAQEFGGRTAQRQQGLEEYVLLRYSPPSSTCRLVPEPPVAPYARRARIPAQEFGRWTTPFSRDSIARLKSTPLCDIPFLPSLARVNLLLFATTMPAPCHRTRPAHDAIPAQEFHLQADPPSLGTQMARLSLWLHKSRSLESSNLHHWSRLSLSSPSHPRELLSR